MLLCVALFLNLLIEILCFDTYFRGRTNPYRQNTNNYGSSPSINNFDSFYFAILIVIILFIGHVVLPFFTERHNDTE
jgi:hypothetical protein